MAEQAIYRPWAEMLAIRPLTPTTFTTVHPPLRMGNAKAIAYGGFALATAVKSASSTLPSSGPTYHLYSLTGNYLGPSSTSRPLKTTVRTIRQTRTFATRLVEVFQTQDNGSDRAVLVALADFQVKEPSMPEMVYSAPPTRPYTHHSSLEATETQAMKLVSQGKVPEQVVSAYSHAFGLMQSLFTTKQAPEGIFAQNLTGIAKHLPTTQDSLPLTQRSTADWLRSKHELPNQEEQVALLAFVLDGAIAFAPLAFSHMFLDDSGATSSLDFALRVFSTEVDLTQWCLREMTTHVGNEGRTYSESRLWDEGGRCVACMTQQSVMRPKKGAAKGRL
ncbi:acyl-CoA thioesterase II [Sporormia fimetaria CBS 119925]|uniref:Acyl-CoA thioesterase II n=1 Tax=Sporormia fimetaria CBS 119925 TaxID=1340428 RepID=A0A6A6VGT8_9PLEO|nr:acyl-CoA thioesterase II [Sporormia fimetaria CBS 119925]